MARPRRTEHIRIQLWRAILVSVGLLTNLNAAEKDVYSLGNLSIQELMNESVTSVSKKPQNIFEAAAAVHVITQEDIQRSGMTSIPEALRMAPGLNVAQINSHTWAISARGFNNEFADKMLVLIDGRTVYDPSFSGVYWDIQNLILDDVDQIEVVRGPGATLWGANAVNGVINITTRKARDTQGVLITAGAGSHEYGVGVRYGGKLSDRAFYRVYLKRDDYDGVENAQGHDRGDEWQMTQGGFALDWDPTERDSFTLQGDLYRRGLFASIPSVSLTRPFLDEHDGRVHASGGNVLGRWSRVLSDGADLSIQAYYDRSERISELLDIRRDTFDAEFQHRFELGSRHEIIWGAGHRYTAARYDDSLFLSYERERDDGHLYSGFVQDAIWLAHEKLRLTLGSKFEQVYDADFAIQPSARLLWTPTEKQALWASVSRAARTPNFNELGLRVNPSAFPGPPGQPVRLISVLPADELKSETVLAYELGYRAQPRERLFLDFAMFYNVYDDLIVNESLRPFVESNPAPVHLTLASRKVNRMRGETYGAEIAPTWSVTDNWKLSAGYSWLQMRLRSDLPNQAGEEQEENSPQHQFHLRSFINLPHRITLDSALYYVDRLAGGDIPGYTRLDFRVAWKPTEQLELSLVARNTLDYGHPEFISQGGDQWEVPRSVLGRISFQY